MNGSNLFVLKKTLCWLFFLHFLGNFFLFFFPSCWYALCIEKAPPFLGVTKRFPHFPQEFTVPYVFICSCGVVL